MATERIVDTSLEALCTKLTELRTQITNLLLKLENEPDKVDRSSILDHYTVITCQLSVMSKLLRDKMPPLRNYCLFPLKLQPDFDPGLELLTEGRIRVFNHEVAPDYLRTKYEQEVEAAEYQVELKANQQNPDQLQRQINSLSKVVSKISEDIEGVKGQIEDSGEKQQSQQTYSTDDTHHLIAVMTYGVGLKAPSDLHLPPHIPSPVSSPAGVSTSVSGMVASTSQPAPNPVKPPPVRTTLKGAINPYARQ